MANNTKNISELLEKYWGGNTSIDEERKIKKFFREKSLDIPSHEYEWLKVLSEFKPETNLLALETIEDFSQQKKLRLIGFSKFFKYAAIFILGISLIYIVYSYSYNRKQSEIAKEVRLRQKAEADLFAISQDLQHGMLNFTESDSIIVNRK